jgi:hypothetical protein
MVAFKHDPPMNASVVPPTALTRPQSRRKERLEP